MSERYAVTFSISKEIEIDERMWKFIKRRLNMQVFEQVLEPTIGDGKYHVIKSEYERDDTDPLKTNFYMSVNHSLAQTQTYYIPEIIEVPETARPACTWCGAVLTLDKRGCCAACGGPAGER